MSALGARSRCSLAPEPHSPLRLNAKKKKKWIKKKGAIAAANALRVKLAIVTQLLPL